MSGDTIRMSPLSDPRIQDEIARFAAPAPWTVYKPFAHLGALVLFAILAVHTSLPWKLIWMLGAASQFIGLYALLHGASHYHLSKNRRLNDVLGMFLATVLGTSFYAYRVSHLRHHIRLRQEDDPQDVVQTCPENRVVTALLIVVASVIGAAPFVWLRVPFYGSKYGSFGRVALEMALPLAFHGVLIGLLVTFLSTSSLLTLLATLVLAIVWGSLVDIVYHQGLPTTGGTECSRSLECDRFGFWVLNGENRHAEHHAYPNIPLPNWRRLEVVVKPAMQEAGAVYERGYVTALLKCVFQCPLFLPPLARSVDEPR